MNRAAPFVLAVSLLVAPAHGQQSASVDLSNPQESAVDSTTPKRIFLPAGCEEVKHFSQASGVVVGKGDELHDYSSIKLEVVHVSETTVKVGGEFEADVRLLNNGKQSILIPWTRDLDEIFNGQDPAHLKWMESFFVASLPRESLESLSSSLFASDSLPSSQLLLGPGEWVTATLKFKVEDAFFPKQLPVKAGNYKLSFKWMANEGTRDVTSDCQLSTAELDFPNVATSQAVAIQIVDDSPVLDQPGNK